MATTRHRRLVEMGRIKAFRDKDLAHKKNRGNKMSGKTSIHESKEIDSGP